MSASGSSRARRSRGSARSRPDFRRRRVDPFAVEWGHPQFGRRLAEKEVDEQQLVAASNSPCDNLSQAALRLTTRRETGLDFEHRAAAWRERSLGGDASAGDENRDDVSRVEGRERGRRARASAAASSRSSSRQTPCKAAIRSRSRAASSKRRASASARESTLQAGQRVCRPPRSSGAQRAAPRSCACRRDAQRPL